MKRQANRLFWVALLYAAGGLASAQPSGEVLTNASQVLSLSPERALKGLPIAVRGVVTAAEGYWDGRFFVQDASGGVFVDNISTQQPLPGDLVEVSGVSHPGAFAPVISKPLWRIVGTAPLPRPRAIAIERLVSGIEDGQRIEIAGVVRTAREEHSLLSVDMVSGGYRFHVFARLTSDLDLQKLIGARARVKGTAAPSFNAQLRQLITVKVFAPSPEDFVVEETELSNPFNQPAQGLATIAQYRKDIAPGTRVHVKGVVIYQRLGEDLFLMDDNGGLRVKTMDSRRFKEGCVVEAVGFPSLGQFLPVLEDSVCQESGEPGRAVVPKRATPEELEAGLHHASLVTLRARLLDRAVRRSLDRASQGMQIKTVLILQSDSLVFSAQMESSQEPSDLVSAPIGSAVEATGVCLSEINEEGRLKLLELLLPESRQIRILQTPSWLTAQRLSVILAMVFITLVLAVIWTVIISKNNSALNLLVREKQQAQQQLELAHDQLEARVKERTEELRLQISAREESELQFKTVLTERTRLAQELHDTLEQTLTGIALQMDTATRLVERSPEQANQHLTLARSLVGQGQAEVRRSVWDLRSRSRQQFDLPGALTASSRQLIDGTGIRVAVTAIGRVRPLPDLIEDNLLRIAQEALTNVIKHAGQTTAKVELDYQAKQVQLTIQDQGKGFEPQKCAGPQEGHFGLLGISERVKRINGRVMIRSAPQMGTTVRVEIPIQIKQEYELPSFAGLDV